MITGESVTAPRAPGRYAQVEVGPPQAPESRPSQAGALDRSGGISAGRPQDLALQPPAPPAAARSKFQREGKVSATTAEPAKAAQSEAGDVAANVVPETAAVGEEAAASPVESPAPALANRKLIRNATVELEIVSFDNAVQKITAFANEEHGYVATTDSEKQANGKLKGQIVVKVLPENLDRFLQKIRSLGELKNQALGTEDVTKAYFDTDSRLKNAHVMEQRLIDMLKTKTGKVSDLLQVEKELGRVREEIEKMQGELKYWDSQVQLATVTISLAEKDMEEPAAFLLKERAQLSLYTPDVEKIYNEIKSLASPKVQITNAQLNRDYSGRVSAQLSMLIAPEESDAVIGRVNGFGRVENFQTQTQRVAQGGSGMSENARTKRDKVELTIAISREEQEQAFQQTSLRIRTSSVDEKAKELRTLAEKQGGRVRSSSRSGKCFAARGDEELPGAHAIARFVRQGSERECATSGPRGRADRRIKRTGGHFNPGLQPGQYCYRGKRLACHGAAYIGAKRGRNYVELANDWCGDRVSRAMGDCNCRRHLDRATRNSRAIETVAGSVSAVSNALGGHRPPLQLTESFLPAPQTSHKLFMFSEGWR